MNSLLESKYISEMNCGANFAYILNENGSFSPTEYKVLQSQSGKLFIKCMKMLYNGKVQIFYVTKSYKPLSAMLPSLDADSFLKIVGNLFASVLEVQHNGFLSCQNVDGTFEHIYIDPNTLKVKLIYLPTVKKLHDDNSSFENELRSRLVRVISGISTLQSAKTMQISADLSNGMLSMEDLSARAKGTSGAASGGAGESGSSGSFGGSNRSAGTGSGAAAKKELYIVAMNAPTRVEIKVTKDEFVLGKKPGACDGLLSFNNMISRVHCRISHRGAQYTITDLQSANGTYVNKLRLQPNQPFPINNGDVIRLANSDFQIVIK